MRQEFEGREAQMAKKAQKWRTDFIKYSEEREAKRDKEYAERETKMRQEFIERETELSQCLQKQLANMNTMFKMKIVSWKESIDRLEKEFNAHSSSVNLMLKIMRNKFGDQSEAIRFIIDLFVSFLNEVSISLSELCKLKKQQEDSSKTLKPTALDTVVSIIKKNNAAVKSLKKCNPVNQRQCAIFEQFMTFIVQGWEGGQNFFFTNSRGSTCAPWYSFSHCRQKNAIGAFDPRGDHWKLVMKLMVSYNIKNI